MASGMTVQTVILLDRCSIEERSTYWPLFIEMRHLSIDMSHLGDTLLIGIPYLEFCCGILIFIYMIIDHVGKTFPHINSLV